MEIRFTQSARRHRIGRSSVRFAITSRGTPGWRWVGDDERGRQLEVIAIEVQGDEDPEAVLLVIHVMPTRYRKEPS